MSLRSLMLKVLPPWNLPVMWEGNEGSPLPLPDLPPLGARESPPVLATSPAESSPPLGEAGPCRLLGARALRLLRLRDIPNLSLGVAAASPLLLTRLAKSSSASLSTCKQVEGSCRSWW